MQTMRCELCGKEVRSVARALVEGTEMTVCENCARFGKLLGRPFSPDDLKRRLQGLEKKKEAPVEVIRIVVPDYAAKIKEGRERLGLTQKEFAMKLAERESLLHQLESGHMKPSIEQAQKFEHALKIKLIEEFKDAPEKKDDTSPKRRTSDAFTLGDFLKR